MRASSTVVFRAVVFKARGPTAGKTAAGPDAHGVKAGNAVEAPAVKPKEVTPGRPEVIATLAAAMTEACTAAGCQDVKARQLELIIAGYLTGPAMSLHRDGLPACLHAVPQLCCWPWPRNTSTSTHACVESAQLT